MMLMLLYVLAVEHISVVVRASSLLLLLVVMSVAWCCF